MSTSRTAWIIFQRSMRFTLRNPAFVVIGIMQPLLYLIFFGPLLTRLTQSPGFDGGNTWRVFVPGLLVQQCLFAAVFVGYGLIAEARGGVIDRMKVTRAGTVGLLLGRVARDVLVLLIQAGLLTVGALIAGLRASVSGVLLAFVVLGLFAAGMSALSYGLALRLRSEEAFGQTLNSLMLPVLLLSGVLLPLSLAPGWLAGIAKANPLSHIVIGLRSLFDGQLTSGRTVTGVAVAAGVAVLAMWFGVRSIRSTDEEHA
jgi:ABC-2 type transport system permease protein